ncbi:hypothetical protein [Polaromonas sp. A23]|uniref:hypothetical protein n=1 Tax=Polaromonas sp. A23 TaxID=1944133 RepID=UPI001115ABFB|nr:hypothetical protein [Polaromonas sp. A23]
MRLFGKLFTDLNALGGTRVLLVVGFMLYVCASAQAQQPAPLSVPMTNGCGSGWNSYLVPDRIKPLACEFKASCDRHDICYGVCVNAVLSDKPQCEYLRCEKGGDLYRQNECDGTKFNALRIAAKARREICDGGFLTDLVNFNKNRPQCRVFAWLYPSVVRVLGASAFIGIDGSVAANFSEAEKQAYADAINAMLSQWSDERLVRFEEQLKTGAIRVDFTKKIAFDPARGLFNP